MTPWWIAWAVCFAVVCALAWRDATASDRIEDEIDADVLAEGRRKRGHGVPLDYPWDDQDADVMDILDHIQRRNQTRNN